MDELSHEFDLGALDPLAPEQVFHLCLATHRPELAALPEPERWRHVEHLVATACPDLPPVPGEALREIVRRAATPWFPTPFHKYSLWAQIFCDPWFTFMNYGYATFASSSPELRGAERVWPHAVALYRHLVAPIELAGRDVVEIACGRGGGAAHLARTHGPRSYLATDGTRSNVRFCRTTHPTAENLAFAHARAEQLPLADGAVDVVLNVESHKYFASFEAFAREAHRVLRADGHLVLAFFDSIAGALAVRQQLAAAGFVERRLDDLTPGVLASQATVLADLPALIAAQPTARPKRDYYELLAGAFRMDALTSGRARYYAGVWQRRR